MDRVKLLVVDDHEILLQGIINLIESFNLNLHLEFESSSTKAFERFSHESYDILITDYEMPDMNGAQLTEKVRSIQNEIKVIILSMHDESYVLDEMIRLNIQGFVLKKEMLKDLKKAISNVSNGGYFFSREIDDLRKLMKDRKDDMILSQREKEILNLIARAYSEDQIAEQLSMSENTFRVHEKNLMRKIKVKERSELTNYALRLGNR